MPLSTKTTTGLPCRAIGLAASQRRRLVGGKLDRVVVSAAEKHQRALISLRTEGVDSADYEPMVANFHNALYGAVNPR